MGKWEREDVKIVEPPKTVVINKRPWVYLDFSKVKFSPIKLIICLAMIADIGLTVFTTTQLITMLGSSQWPNAGLIYGGLLAGEIFTLFCLMGAYAFASGDVF